MNFKISGTCPQNVDTVVCFVRPEYEPKFNCALIQSAFDEAFAGDDNKMEAGSQKTLRMKLNGKFINLVSVCFDCSTENAFDGFRKAVLKIGTKLN